MNDKKTISGFSKLSKRKKIKWLVENFFKDPESVMRELKSYWLPNEEEQKLLDGFSENTISNYMMPYSVAPNFVIDGKTYCVPMVIEESSVVAAASSAAKFWMSRGGFKTSIPATRKIGQVHFTWSGDISQLQAELSELSKAIRVGTQKITRRMEERGGGIRDIDLLDYSAEEPNYYQLRISFETCESMGANFINSVLEESATILKKYASGIDKDSDLKVIMSILSNYTPECVVRAEVSCPVADLGSFPNGMDAEEFATKFAQAVRIAHIDPYRATTHNKGIYNGVDAVVLATGNDFRAIEAAGHTHAAKDGQYRSLSHCTVDDGVFTFWLEIPLALGTVGGLTSLHPVAKRSLELLDNPKVKDLMSVIASTGLAQNFAALRSLVTTGIQKGHMKMHLVNILKTLEATDKEVGHATQHFADEVVSFSAVQNFLLTLRSS